MRSDLAFQCGGLHRFPLVHDVETGAAQLIHFGGQYLGDLQAGALLVKVCVVQQVVNPQGVDFEQDCVELLIDFDGTGQRRGLFDTTRMRSRPELQCWACVRADA